MKKLDLLKRRKKRVRSKLSGTQKRPRLSVYRSIKHIYAQLIDDDKGITLVSASDLQLKDGVRNKMTKLEKAMYVGEVLAKKAAKRKIVKVAFDRAGRKYHGRLKSLAEGARKGGLKF